MNALALLGLASKSEVDALKKELDELKKTVDTHHSKNGSKGFSDQDPFEFVGTIDSEKVKGRDKHELLEKNGFGK